MGLFSLTGRLAAFGISAAAADDAAALVLDFGSAFRTGMSVVLCNARPALFSGNSLRFLRIGLQMRDSPAVFLVFGNLEDDAGNRIRTGGAVHPLLADGRRAADPPELGDDFLHT